jgi:hypothetical protein
MRRCKIVTWILILSIINFALGAPAAVRGRLETSVDVDVAECGIATSQKRYDPLDDWSTTNSADRPPTPLRLTPSEVDQLWEDVAEQRIDRYSPPTPESHGSTESVDSNWPNYAPSNPGSPTGSHPGPTGGSPLHPLPHPGPSEDRFPSPPGFSVNPGTLSSTGHQPKPPQSPPGWSVNPGTSSSTAHQPTPPQSPTDGSPLPHPGPSEDRFPRPPGRSANPDRFLDELLKGKIKRRISGPRAAVQ